MPESKYVRYSKETNDVLKYEGRAHRSLAREEKRAAKHRAQLVRTEAYIKRIVKDRLNEIGAYHHWPVQLGMGQPCLDCHGCYIGLYFAVETKATGKKPTLRQEATIQRIRDAGGRVFVVDSTEKAHALFSNCVKGDGANPRPL